ncbi:MAG TPA: hypothetical protein VGJ50_02830 [Streptosporangiaceae bacterium]
MGLRHLYRIAALLIAGLAVAGCVAPEYTYVTDSSDNAYFKVPPSWRQVSQSRLEAAQGPSSQDGAYLWSRAYEDNTKPSIQHVFAASSRPIAYASVVQLSASERNDMSFNSMRDLLLPVTANARKAASAAHAELAGFSLLGDQVVTNNHNYRGIREIFNYNLGATPETFDLTVMTNSDTTKLYFLLVHCTETCFASHYPQISQVVGSFTVGGGS